MVKTARPQAPVVFGSSKVRVQVSADGSSYEGDVHLHGDARRIQEVLNDPRPFLNLTDVAIRSEGGGTTKASYVALNKGAITHVLVLGDDAVASISAPGSAATGGDATHPVLPTTGAAKSGAALADSDGLVDDLSVSDLLIDDDDPNDDLDLGDFE
jgi:hypothetical protein